MQKAEVLSPPEAFRFRQDMPEHQLQELCARQRSGLPCFSFAVLIAEGDLTIPAGNDVLFLNDAFVKIASEINQRFVAAVDRLDVHDPLFGVASRQR